jgi:hypothetical protein
VGSEDASGPEPLDVVTTRKPIAATRAVATPVTAKPPRISNQ